MSPARRQVVRRADNLPARRPTAAELMTGKAATGTVTPRPAAKTRPAAKPAKALVEAGDDLVVPHNREARQSKPVRITIDLDADRYAAVNRWLMSAAVAANPDTAKRISLAQAVRAMIDATTRDEVVTSRVLGQLRRDQP